ncbi:hypothetical protein KEM56_000548 [Ascosphaera pollenicola]|nr:hypothetical protein KEM56_000548 [Ascosphaera pollenicola]
MSKKAAIVSLPSEDCDTLVNQAPSLGSPEEGEIENTSSDDIIEHEGRATAAEAALRRKIDLRLCTIAGILCSLNLIDSGIISSASVTTMFEDLSLQGQRYSVAIFIFTIASVVFQLPSTIAVRIAGPRIYFACATTMFGVLTLCTAFVRTWRQMIALRVLLGISMSGIYPGLTYLISTWYPRHEQQLRFAFLQSGEVIVLASGNIMNYGLNKLDGRGGLAGWKWMYLVNGILTVCIGFVTYWWMIDFPEKAHLSKRFLTPEEVQVVTQRIQRDRKDADIDPFSWSKIYPHFLDFKLYGFMCLFFLLNLVSTSMAYYLPIILQNGMGFDANKSILFSALPYYYAVIPVLLTSFVSDRYQVRGPLISFNALCLIAGFLMFGLPSSHSTAVRYIGTFLTTGAYVSNWAALSAYQANNIVGQWKRATVAAAVTAANGLGGVAGSYIVRQKEAPHYPTALWVSVGRQRAGLAVIEGVSGFRYTL